MAKKPEKPVATAEPESLPSNVKFDGQEVTVIAAAGSAIEQAAKEQSDVFTDAAARAVLATYEPGEPPTSRTVEGKGKNAFAFADCFDVGSATFRSLYAELLSDGPFEAFCQATIHAMKPQDAFEALLVAQMSAVHAAMMNMTGRLAKAEYLERSRFYEGAVNRLARTYAAQMEALRKHRGNGTQTVRHVHVNEGGQAVVADTVNHLRSGADEEPK